MDEREYSAKQTNDAVVVEVLSTTYGDLIAFKTSQQSLVNIQGILGTATDMSFDGSTVWIRTRTGGSSVVPAAYGSTNASVLLIDDTFWFRSTKKIGLSVEYSGGNLVGEIQLDEGKAAKVELRMMYEPSHVLIKGEEVEN